MNEPPERNKGRESLQGCQYVAIAPVASQALYGIPSGGIVSGKKFGYAD